MLYALAAAAYFCKKNRDEMKSKILFLAAGALCAYGCANRHTGTEQPPVVRIDTVGPCTTLPALEFPGRVEAPDEVGLAFKVSGTLQQLFAEEGDRIVEGQLLARLDPRDYRLQAEAAEAEYRRIEAEARRIEALHADSVATSDSYDKARYGLRQIAAKYEHARNQLADTEIRAPFDGYMQRCLFDPPTVVAAGMPVATIVSAGLPEVVINIPASVYVRRRDFEAFEASFDFLPAERIPLRLLSIAPKANANQLYAARLAVPSGIDPAPAPGMNTLVTLRLRTPEDARLGVPATALFSHEGESSVWLLRPDNTVERRTVAIERLTNDGTAVVGGGLAAGDRIVTSGVHRLHEGQQVKPRAAASATNIGGML